MPSTLKRIELSGFKSFAKAARFEFDAPIVAIVGPNGSGKSNVVEAIRWALGEQSVKQLRGQRGEDLIFNGSPSSPRLSKASVSAVFDNSRKQFPVGFDEVVIGRRIYRDGKSEYLLNDSEVRLKDVVELLAHAGLGVSQHPIITQGEADRILYVSSKERQGMIEEALGLKVYQYKREEAERKLTQTEENMKQASALRAEIRPHLDHLKRLVDKYRRGAEIKAALSEKFIEYFSAYRSALARARRAGEEGKEAPATELKDIRKKLSFLRSLRSGRETNDSAFFRLEEELAKLRDKRMEGERELGRAEGLEEAARATGGADDEAIPREEVEELLVRAEDDLSTALETDALSEIHDIVQNVIDRLAAFLTQRAVRERARSDAHTYAARVREWKETLADALKSERAIAEKLSARREAARQADAARHSAETEAGALDARERELEDVLRRLSFEQESLAVRAAEYEREWQDARRLDSQLAETQLTETEPLTEAGHASLRREIDRMKFRLEEAGGVDATVLREYEDASARDTFFERELGDLTGSAKRLREVSRDLAKKIEVDFTEGVRKINAEFERFFQTMFGGGAAKLVLLKERKPIAEDEEGPASEEGGVHIDVQLPRKKIRGLEALSGGERSLTAVALLFALSTVSPPPFLVLDETDAALDEANSLRYGDMLKELSHRTQVITVTHNRQTMRRAGILYGVTAGSDGVSRLLSLKLAEAEGMAQA